MSVARIANENNEDPIKSFVCVNYGIHQIRKAKVCKSDESFCDENKNLQPSIKSRVQRTNGIKLSRKRKTGCQPVSLVAQKSR